MQLRVLLFENMIVLLQKTDEKYLMKSFANPTGIGENAMVSPITKICNTIVRLNAVDNRAFFLINQTDSNSQMLELTAPSQGDSEVWIRRITEAAEKANHLKKVQSKPLPAVPVPPPPPTLEETPENLLNAEEPPEVEVKEQPEPTQQPETEEPEPEPEDDPNAIQTTQPCQLIQPTEISVEALEVQEASRVVTPEESLKRHGDVIQTSVSEMQKIICEINRVPPEHFAEIADIAAQPEAQSDLADLALAAFAQSKFLVECLRTALINGTVSAPLSGITGVPALCDNCVVNETSDAQPTVTKTLAMETESDGDNLYCEIEPLKEENAAVVASKVSHMEINETYSGSNSLLGLAESEAKKNGSIKVEKIAASVTALNSLVSQLTVSVWCTSHACRMHTVCICEFINFLQFFHFR
jgi:hypothetical protein